MSEGTGGAPPFQGRSVDDVRRENLGRVLRLAHLSGPASRAELTRATGLNRSTIGGLVSELQERGLVEEEGPAVTRKVGRPSLMVSPSDRTVALVINPEVDRVDIGVVGLSGRVLQRVRYENERLPTVTEFVNLVRAMSDMLLAGHSHVVGAGLAIPGLVRESDGHILLAPHLGWEDAPIGRLLHEAIGLDVVAGNDANCGAIAESTYGAGRGDGIVVYLNGGASGIGGGLVMNGRLLSGEDGHAAEFGHTMVTAPGRPCHCGAHGCLETEVRRDRFLAAAGRGIPPGGTLADLVRSEWARPSSPGRAELDRQLDFLAVAMRTVVNAVNPRRIVLGGYLAEMLRVAGEDLVKQRAGATLPGGMARVTLEPAALGDDVLLVGAAELVFAPILDDPTRVPLPVDALA
jgi:predicted NBD/HSP70 family sugar kinase